MEDIKLKRSFVEDGFKLSTWEDISGYFQELESRELGSVGALRQWFKDRSELEAIISEDMAWRYIRMTCDTGNAEHAESFQYFVQQIQPKISPVSNSLNQKALDSSYLLELEKQPGWDILIREMRKEIEIFREENIPIFTELRTLSQNFSKISGGMTVIHEDKELTLQQAAVYLQSTDRVLREEVYHLIAERRLIEREALDSVFNQMVTLRTTAAKNAGFENFRDYMFRAMGRFDYTPQDCFDFHESISAEMVPLLNDQATDRKSTLQVDQLRPWDKAVDKQGKAALVPFKGGDNLLEKTIRCFNRIDPFLGECLTTMHQMGHLDLESRTGKAPGGYNYPLSESGVPFIFMNATSTVRDMVTLLHEGGHAVHSFVTADLELTDFKSTPSEVAELASMSMELISMDHWDVYFEDEEELKRAKREHLEQIIETLPWVATIDKFQHWLYENPAHSVEERNAAWIEIFDRFSDDITDWSSLELNKQYLWQKQLHLFEVPFYYIEYGMAQLGAIAVWKRYRENPAAGLEGYLNALKLGYTQSIPRIYKTAGIKFDFSRSYIKELVGFVQKELEGLN